MRTVSGSVVPSIFVENPDSSFPGTEYSPETVSVSVVESGSGE
ncbi:MAG: hypothetical protein Q4C47_05175 [Planctomycetia bacterium]|nr:hypothetical protein [Planctomycetia bacterium]